MVQQLFLGLVLAGFATFIGGLLTASIWTGRGRD